VRLRAVIGAVAWRNLHNFFFNPALFVPALLFPLFFFTAFAGGLSGIGEAPGFDFDGGYTAFQFTFVLLQASLFGGVFTGFAIARDFESGFGRRMMLAAPNRLGILLGYAVAALVRTVAIWTILTAIALLVGMEVGGSAAQLAGMYGLAAIMNVAALGWASGIALRFRSIQAGPLMQFPTFLVLFIAPVYVPAELLTGWVEVVAGVNPITPVLEAARGFISGGEPEVGLAFAAALGMVALFGAWAVRGLRSAEAAGG
jgi:ABC-2 type transport system permease protein